MSSPLKTKYKILMFLSSYAPLFFILFLKSLSKLSETISGFINSTVPHRVFENMTYVQKTQIIGQHLPEIIQYSKVPLGVTIVILVIIGLSIFTLREIISETKKTNNPMSLYIVSVQKMDSIYIEYLFTYVIPFISFDYSSIIDMISLFIFLVTACIIYINSDLLYVNIFFSIRRYHLFKIINEEQDEYIVLSKKKQLYVNKIIEVKDVSASSERFVLDLRGVE
jgi:hypothetical protein